MSKGKDLKPHIGIFGRRNYGKSSLINALVGQDIAIVSDVAGTTTDPVSKSIEILGIGPVVIIDTAGIDDIGELGLKRVEKTFNVIKKIDCAIIIITDNNFESYEINLISEFNKYDVKYFIVYGKSDISKISKNTIKNIRTVSDADIIEFTTKSNDRLQQIISSIKKNISNNSYKTQKLLDGLVKKNDIVFLVTPIDSEAPEGRLILPQQMTIRNILDNNATAIVMQEKQLSTILDNKKLKPNLIIADSQVFNFVKNIVPTDIPLTSFSIIFSRFKGDFDSFINGVKTIDSLKDGDNVLIMESCTHHLSCDDIGQVRIPNLLKNFTGKKLNFTHASGLNTLPENISDFKLVIQCGACMITRKQLLSRLKQIDSIPITNYGMVLAYINGIFQRAIKPFNKKNNND